MYTLLWVLKFIVMNICLMYLLLTSSRKDPEKRNLLEIEYNQKIRRSISFMEDLARGETNQKILKTSKIIIFR